MLETWEWCQNAQKSRFPIPPLETTMVYLHQKKNYLKKTKFSLNPVMTFTSMPTDAGNTFIVAQFNINHLVIVTVIVLRPTTDLHGISWSRLLELVVRLQEPRY